MYLTCAKCAAACMDTVKREHLATDAILKSRKQSVDIGAFLKNENLQSLNVKATRCYHCCISCIYIICNIAAGK